MTCKCVLFVNGLTKFGFRNTRHEMKSLSLKKTHAEVFILAQVCLKLDLMQYPY